MAYSVGQIEALTKRFYDPKINDLVLDQNVVFKKLYNSGGVNISGGEKIMETIRTKKSISGTVKDGQTVAINMQQDHSAAAFEIKRHYAVASIGRSEQLKNAGVFAVKRLMDSKYGFAAMDLADDIAADIFATGSSANGDSSDGVNSLDTVCQDASTTLSGVSVTLGGITKTTETAWAGKVTNWAGAAASGKAWSDFNTWFLTVCDGNVKPNMCLMGTSVYGTYTKAGFNQQRLVDKSAADLGFLGASLNQTPIYLDLHITDSSATATDNRAYLLNTNFLFLRTHTEENMRRTPWVEPVDQVGDMVTKIGWAGELTTNDCSRQSALYNFT